MTSRTSLLACTFALFASLASAQRDPQEESKILEELAAVAPGAVTEFQAATEAMDRGDNEAADSGYGKVLDLAPDFAHALRRRSYVVADNDEGLALARRALLVEEHGYNLSAVVDALLRFDDPAKLQEANRLAERLVVMLPDEPSALSIVAAASLRSENLALFRKAIGGLRRVAPDEMATHYYAAFDAGLEEDWIRAEAEIERARELGLPAEEADAFLDGTGIRSRARNWRYLYLAGHASVAWVGGLLALLGIGAILSRWTLSAIESQSAETTGLPSGAMRMMRRVYGIVLSLASLYFYVSMPFVFILVVAASGGLIYALLSLGYIPLKLLLIAFILLFVTLWAMLKGLLARGGRSDPGERLEEKDAPEVFSLLREVASKIGTPMVDSVFLVPDATVAVFERGSTLDHLRHRGERCLVLGLGVMDGMKLGQLKGILAHEYGHLSNRDTAGGGLALQVRRSILTSAETLASGGAAVWYNPAWLFLNAFFRLYLRISQGASRLQEVLADRWAVLAYGKEAFSSGLSHAVRRAVEFDFLSQREIFQAVRESRPLRNLYDLKVPLQWAPEDEPAEKEKPPAQCIEEAYQEALSTPASPYDSHPATAQRIAWVEKMTGVASPPMDERDAWSLFPDRNRIQELVTRQVSSRVQAFIARQQEFQSQSAGTESEQEIVTLGLSSDKK